MDDPTPEMSRSMMPGFRTDRLYPLLVGFLLGSLQTGLFFQLTFTLSSGFTIYLLIVICWLLGSVVGVFYVSRWNVSLRALLLLMLLAYAACCWLVNANPFDTQVWLYYAVLIVIVGIYPGVFFAQASDLWLTRSLFFWENNGFVAGLVISTILFMLMGRSILLAMPILFAGIAWLWCPVSAYRTALTA
jgi:hypothetical protein